MIHVSLIGRRGSTQLSANVTFSFHRDEAWLQDLMQLQQRGGNFAKHVEVFSMYSCHDKKGRVGGFLRFCFFFQEEKLGCRATVLPFSLSHSAVQHLKPTAHHTWGALGASQKKLNIWKAHSKWWIVSVIQITMASNEIENIYLWKITAFSCYQSPFVSTNSISFLSKK